MTSLDTEQKMIVRVSYDAVAKCRASGGGCVVDVGVIIKVKDVLQQVSFSMLYSDMQEKADKVIEP